MTNTSPLLIKGLRQLGDRYDVALCDVWGVLHNGVAAFEGAADALRRFRLENGGTVVLITNAPRPNAPIREQLQNLGIGPDAYDDIVTSGDVTRHQILARGGAPLLHIGPQRDMSLFEGLRVQISSEENADSVVCTGLLNDTVETPDDYRAQFERLTARGAPMICANPDIVVERGDTLIWCAGALARLYEDLGGDVAIAGKPHHPIYDAALKIATKLRGSVDQSRVLAIGDGLPTDIRGAFAQKLDALFITAGIHAADFGPADAPSEDLIRNRLAEEGLNAAAAIPRLAW